MKYTILPMETLLRIYHGNADVERSLSDNKNVMTGIRMHLGSLRTRTSDKIAGKRSGFVLIISHLARMWKML